MKSDSQRGGKSTVWRWARWPYVASSLVVAAAFAIAWYLMGSRFGIKEGAQATFDPDKVLVLRTPGGLLEVATLERSEAFSWKAVRTCRIIDCSDWIKPTISELRVKAHYVYRIELSSEWRLMPAGEGYVLRVPDLKPSLPIAIDTKSIEVFTTRGWLSPRAAPNESAVLKHLGPELAQRAQQKAYLDFARPAAAKTVEEYARKWMPQPIDPNQKIQVQFDTRLE